MKNVAIEKLSNKCCGCMACVNICPVQALNITIENGFSKPELNSDKCIQCGLCVKSCPVLQAEEIKVQKKQEKVFIVKNKNLSERIKGTSGGVFFPLAASIIEGGGTVYGATYTEELHVKHCRADCLAECRKFQGSKYVQSDISECYKEIEKDLISGREVMFSGTPCQIAAVRRYLESRRICANLFLTVEILCYGVPSPELFSEHIYRLEREYGEIQSYCFRDERDGWDNQYKHCVMLSDNTEIYNTKELQAFGSLFSKRINMRESCFDCAFSSTARCADITIGDCWGIQNINMAFADTFGISQVLCNTSKGFLYWNKVKKNFDYEECDLERIISYNTVLSYPAEKPKDYKQFWNDYKTGGFERILKKYTVLGKTYMIRKKLNKLKRILERK